MKKISLLLVTALCCMALSSCSIVTSRNGDLDGLWQVMLMENLATGETQDMRDLNANWAVQGDLLMMRMNDQPDIICHFNHNNDLLQIIEPNISDRYGETGTDIKIEDVSILHPYGLYVLDECFKVLQLDGDVMRLESSSVRLAFRRY